jgi:hypothetical protein
MTFSRFILFLTLSAVLAVDGPAQITLTPAEAEAQKCEDKIASVRREVLNKYEGQLGELQAIMQKAADLEGALAVRAERQRLATEQDLSEANLVAEPKSLRTIQTQTVARINELSGQLIDETMPRLLEFKKQLTMAGKLDEAVKVRESIERLQNAHLPINKADASTATAVETIIQAYTADRPRADKIYKGQKITVHGVLGAYRPDPADVKAYQIFLTGNAVNGWVQCVFSAPNFRFREEKGSFGAVSLVMLNKEGDVVARMQKGQVLDIRGQCDGFDDVVHLNRCDQIK